MSGGAAARGADPLAAPGVAVVAEGLLALRRHVGRGAAGPAPAGLPGGVVGRRRGRGLEPADLRAFQDGDDPRHIDRNATARTGRAQVKTFRDERERAVLLAADLRPQMLWGTRARLNSVTAVETLALAGWRAIATGGRVGLYAFGAFAPVFVPLRPGEAAMAAVVAGLVRAHRAALSAGLAGEPPLDAAVEPVAALAPRGGQVVLATALDQPGPEFDALARAIDRRARLAVLLVTDAFAEAPPPGAYPIAGPRGVVWARAGGGGPDGRLARLARLGLPAQAVAGSCDPAAAVWAVERLDALA